jgi:hypothetical protein
MLALGQTVATRGPLLGGARPSLAVPSIDVPAGDGALGGLLDLMRWAAVAFETLAAGSSFQLSLPGIGLALVGVVSVSVLVGAAGASALVAMATRSLLKPPRT